jgi:nicotinamidase-related amidase
MDNSNVMTRLNPENTAMLTLDLQLGILDRVSESRRALEVAAKAVEMARKNGYLLIHVGLGFETGHPEIGTLAPPNFKVAKDNNLFVKGTQSTTFHDCILKPDDVIVYKQRTGAFTENQLQLILRSQGIENLVFFGISTSGIVLSTVRHAYDLDYRCTIIEDACCDPDPDTHRFLMEKIYPKQATVIKLQDFQTQQA